MWMATDAIGCEKAEELKSRINEINSTLPIKTYTYISTILHMECSIFHITTFAVFCCCCCWCWWTTLINCIQSNHLSVSHFYLAWKRFCIHLIPTQWFNTWNLPTSNCHDSHLHSNSFVGQSRDWTVELLRYCVIFFSITY